MKMMHATRLAGMGLLFICGAAHADLIIDVNGTQVIDDPSNAFLTLSGSLNGLNYGINLWGANGTDHGGPQNILLFNSGFTLNSTVSAPVTFTITETNLTAIPGYDGSGFVGGNSLFCSVPPDSHLCQLQGPGLTAGAWFDPTNSGSKITVISDGTTVPPYGSQGFNSGSLALSAPFSLTDQFTVDPLLFSLAQNGVVSVEGRVDYVPEPSILSLMALGLASIGFTWRRRKKRFALDHQVENSLTA